VSASAQLEEVVEQRHDAPVLLVEWSSPWREFVTAVRPALARSDARLAGEAPYGMFPYRGMIPCLLLEAFLIFAAIVVKVKLDQMRPYVAPRLSSRDVIYYSGDELPRTEDLGGAQAGTVGRAGGGEAHHRTQTIRIARGGSLAQSVVDAPNLKLPSSRDAVANLLAVNPNPGPPPSEGLRSTRTTLTYLAPIVAPAPQVIPDYTRNGVRLDTVIAPTPSLPRDPFRAAPNLSATVIPPAPSASSDRTLVAPALGPAVIPPAPSVSHDRTSAAPSLNPTVVAPAPIVSGNTTRSAPERATIVIPPAPGAVSREISSAPVQTTNVAIVPPPVSTPERATNRNPRLAMPAPSVIAPPPSADISQDLRRLASGNAPDPSKTVVPPPPSQTGGGSYMSGLIGKIFGATEVVPPPPTVSANASNGSRNSSLNADVVPPPPAVSANAANANPRGNRNGMGASLGSNVIAPPPSSGVLGGSGTRPVSASTAPALGMPSVVPPPPSVSGPGGGTGDTGGGKGAPGGTLLASNVVPPPPSVGGGANSTGSGLGRKGPGLGSAMETGAPSAPSGNGGSGTGAGAVISNQPGSKVGLPAVGGKGSLAMSPTGGDKPGLGGTGGGTSIARGNGPGSGMNGVGPGTGKSGPGHGSDPNARSGISPNPGPGGTGNATNGTPPVPGVSVQGGSSIVTLPSFGSDPSGGEPAAPGRSNTKQQRQALGVTIVATATSGGAFEPYKNQLHGEISTTYLETSLGTVVVEFADGGSGAAIVAPTSFRTDLPEGLPHARMVVACTIDASGNLKNVRVLEPGPAEMTAKIVASLRSWKLQPAMRGEQPIEVTAILGFGIDTNDRF
jgi:Gram-negative bacterial TonB protein C-terminal